jgi:hypothetical protein
MDATVREGYSRSTAFGRALGGNMSGRLSIFQAKARTAETYLAGVGASGALMASAFVLFIVLVGVVTFNAWPHPGQLIAGSGGNVSLKDVTLTNQQPQPAPTPNLVALLGGPATAAATPASNRGGGGGGADATRPSRVVGIGSGLGTSSPGGGTGTGTGGGSSTPPQTTTVTPSLPGVSDVTRAGGLGQVVAGVGNNVQSDTNSLGNSLGGPNSALGGLVQGLGTTLNNTLQQLGGTR